MRKIVATVAAIAAFVSVASPARADDPVTVGEYTVNVGYTDPYGTDSYGTGSYGTGSYGTGSYGTGGYNSDSYGTG